LSEPTLAAERSWFSKLSGVPRPQVLGIGTANPVESFTQFDVLELLGVSDARVRSLYASTHINKRHLLLPPKARRSQNETQGQLLERHRDGGIELGSRAIRQCLSLAGLRADELGYLCCVTSTGWLTPGFSAMLVKQLGLDEACARVDIVGMGCNAGVNGLKAVTSWAAANPGRVAVLACIEVCSAAYVVDGTMRTAVVNSLFGDGAAAVAVGADPGFRGALEIVDFESVVMTETIDAMRFDWDDASGRFSFYLDPDIPYVIGANVERPISRLLSRNGLRASQVDHWVVHSGGKKVIDALRVNLGLSPHDLRHTTSVLAEFGNLSSGSFLFSLERLLSEGDVAADQTAVIIAMGPGCTIETALARSPRATDQTTVLGGMP
jgi:3,5-dihydroxyphenylacetyl-CoA synthase